MRMMSETVDDFMQNAWQEMVEIQGDILTHYLVDCDRDAPARLAQHGSIDYIEELIDFAVTHDVNRAERITLTLCTSFWAIRWGKADTWRRFLVDAYRVIGKHQDPSQMTLYHRAWSLIHEMGANLDASVEHGRLAYEYSLQSDDPFIRKAGLARYAQALITQDKEDLRLIRATLEAYTLDVVASQSDGDIPVNQIIVSVSQMIEIDRKLGEHASALALADMFTVRLDDTEVDDDNKAEWHHNCGLIACWLSEDYQRAEEDLTIAQHFFEQVNDVVGVIGAQCDYGMNALQQGDLRRAYRAISASHQLALRHSSHRQMAILHGNMGLVLASQGYTDLAIPYFEAHRAMGVSYQHEHLRALANHAYVHVRDGDYATARYELEQVAQFRFEHASSKVYWLALLMAGFAQCLCDDFDAVNTTLTELEAFLMNMEVPSPRYELLLQRLRAYADSVHDEALARQRLKRCIETTDNIFFQGMLWADVCRFSTGIDREEAWRNAQQAFKKAGAEGWLSYKADAPPMIFPT